MRRAARASVSLPAREVRLGPEYVRRLERLVVRLAAARERREGAGSGALAGGGLEVVGYRPWRPGEDPRPIDWNLFARLDRPYVRVTRREASEEWCVLLDRSASMGVGPPGKLQCAAELACALAAVGLRGGARVLALASPGEGDRVLECQLHGRAGLARALGFFGALVAQGSAGLAALLAERRPPATAGRVFVVGDLCDLEPARVHALARRGRELFVVQVLAPEELSPRTGAVEWRDPEGPGRRALEVDAGLLAEYERALARELGAWRAFALRHGLRYALAASDVDFEQVVRALLESS